ncbi:MAG: hypothetical protein ABIA77_02170, partial [Candidatus Omnitrophota bacterium]
SWIPDGQIPYIQGLLNELTRLARSGGISNITIKRANGERLAGEILDETERTGTSLSNVIILGDHKVLQSRAFDPFRPGHAPENHSFFAGIELPEEFNDNSYVRLLEMLETAMALAFGEPVTLDNPYIRIIREGTRSCIFVPKAEAFDYELLKEIYDGQAAAMVSA